jgi:hypothetical protein
MNIKLHDLTVEALRHKASVASDTYDPADEETNWAKTADEQCRAVAITGTVDALKASKVAQEELENYLAGDMPPRELTTVVSDLCRAGAYELYDPNAVCTRRIKTRTVEGLRYVTGQ